MNSIVIYNSLTDGTSIDVNFYGETVWLSQKQLVKLFTSSKANISEHLKDIFYSQELDQSSTVRNFRIVQKEGKREV